jgi:hypothetical protein
LVFSKLVIEGWIERSPSIFGIVPDQDSALPKRTDMPGDEGYA